MKNIIAFVGQISDEDKQRWLSNINPLLSDMTIVLYEHLTEEQKLIIEVAIVANPDPQELLTLRNLRWVQSLWAGVERLLSELQSVSFGIVRMIDPNLSQTMAEAVLAWTLYLHRDMPKYRFQQSHKIWKQHELIDIKARNIGILGLGTLGKAAAQKLVLNDFNVLGWSRRQAELEGVKCFSGNEGLQHLLKQTDILVCLLPLTQETTRLLNHENLGLLKKGGSLINFSRGQVLHESALLQHLSSGHLVHAVLDVFNEEPLDQMSSLWENHNITILPHISAPTNTQTASKIVAEHLSKYFQSGNIPDVVIPERGY